MSDDELDTQISKKKDEIKNIEALIKTSMEEDIKNRIINEAGQRINGDNKMSIGEKYRERLHGNIRELEREIENLNEKPESVGQDSKITLKNLSQSLSEIINKLKESGGKIVITQTEKECFIRYESISTDTEGAGDYTSLPDDPKEFAINPGQSIIIKKQGDTLQYKIVEGDSETANSENGYLLYTVSGDRDSPVPVPVPVPHIDLIKPQQGFNVFDNLVDKLQGRYFVLIQKNGGYAAILSRFMINADKNIGEYKNILNLISKIIRTVHSLYSNFNDETTRTQLKDSLNKQLNELKKNFTSLESKIVTVLTELKTETSQYSQDWLPFLKTIDEIKTEFINTLININILFETTEEERDDIINNNLTKVGQKFGESIFEKILKKYLDNLNKFFNALTKFTSNLKEYEFDTIEDIKGEESEIIEQDYDDEGYENEGDLELEEFEEDF